VDLRAVADRVIYKRWRITPQKRPAKVTGDRVLSRLEVGVRISQSIQMSRWLSKMNLWIQGIGQQMPCSSMHRRDNLRRKYSQHWPPKSNTLKLPSTQHPTLSGTPHIMLLPVSAMQFPSLYHSPKEFF
jgi:hypothetical protein